MMSSPWFVTTLDEFRYYFCPECELKEKSRDKFLEHAITQHPNSKDFLEMLDKFKKEEPNDENSNDFYQNDNYIEENYDMVKYGNHLNEIDNEEEEEKLYDIINTDKVRISPLSSKSKRFPCSKCGKSFTSPAALRIHFLPVHEGRRFDCKQCEKSFTQFTHLKKHLKSEHQVEKDSVHDGSKYSEVENENILNSSNYLKNSVVDEVCKLEYGEEEQLLKIKKKYPCKYCNKCFASPSLLEIHVLPVHEGKKFHCQHSDCDKYFTQLQNLKKHMKNVHNEECDTSDINPYIVESSSKSDNYCDICKVWINQGSLQTHIQTVHEGKSKKFMCKFCENSYTNSRNLILHIRQRHDPLYEYSRQNNSSAVAENHENQWQSNKRPKISQLHQCTFCIEKFKSMKLLKEHSISVHNVEKFLKCESCGKMFGNQLHLKGHVDVIHKGIKNHVCDTCGKAFSIRIHLKHHRMKHEGQKDHKCKICGKSYYTTSDLKKHIQCVHEKQNPICSLCGKVFSMVCALNKHIRTQHEGLKREEKIPCEICQKMITAEHMKRHIKDIHEGEKNQKCQICNYATARKSNLRVHVEKVHKVTLPL